MKQIAFTILLNFAFAILLQAQKGIYLEYKASIKGKEEIVDSLKIVSLNGNSINELINLKYPKSPNKTLFLKSDPNMGYRIMQNKTFFKMPDSQLSEYKINILGNEIINGFNCIKIELTTQDRTDNQYTLIWISTAPPYSENFMTATINGISLTKLNNILKKNNLNGVPIRITYSQENSLQYDFIKATLIDLDPSIFSLNGYHEDKGSSSDDLLKQNKISNEKYDLMKQQELITKKFIQQQDSINRKK